MSNQYSPQLPVDKAGGLKQGYPPPRQALATSNGEAAVTSSILLLTHDTTELEVAAITNAVAGKWLTQAIVDSSVAGTSVLTGVATANFDFVVPSNSQRHLVVPIATGGRNANASVQGVNRAEGLYPAVAFKTLAGIGSVVTMQF